MELWQAIILGIVEGLTEYLPVSSTGHLLVVQRLLGIASGEAADAYAIVIQAGAIAAVLGLYRRRVAQMVRGLAGREPAGARLVRALVVAFLPAAIAGLALDRVIEAHLFGPWPVVFAWAAGGILLLAVSSRLRGRHGFAVEEIGLRAALWIGLAQCLALWPGVSRSLVTILGALAVGVSMEAAVEFSFLLGFVTLGAATAYKLVDSHAALMAAYHVSDLVAGFVVAWVAAAVAVRWMVAWLNHHGLGLFGWWRLGAAVLVASWLLTVAPR